MRIPKHLVIIPDGNRRWAKKRNLPEIMGHNVAGDSNNFLPLLEEAKKLGVKYFSFWGFSTENWKRGEEERDNIFNLILKNLKKMEKNFHKNKIRFRHFGRKDRLPKKLLKEIRKVEEATKNYDDFNIQLCVDYGGRDEILRAINQILKDGKKTINEKIFASYLDTAEIPDPDFIIRTSKEKRLSGFALRQNY